VPKHSQEEEEREGLKRVDNVVCDLRHLLFPPLPHESAQDRLLRRRIIAYQRASQQSGPGYQLAGLPWVWLDVEEIGAHLKRARVLEQFGEEGLAEWRAAYDLASQGLFLPGEIYSDWATTRRQEVEASLWDSVQVLWRRVVEQGEAGQREAVRLLRTYWQSHVTQEDALRPLLELLGKRECFGEAEAYYAQLCQILEEEGRQPDRRTREVMDFLRALQIQRKPTIIQSGKASSNGYPASLLLAHQCSDLFSPLSQAAAQDRMAEACVTEGDLMDQLRRQILHQALQGTGVAWLASSDLTLGSELAGRLVKALTSPSHLDETTLRYLERQTANYWQDRHQAVLSSSDLLSYVLEHLQRIIACLEQALLPRERLRLCALASQTAQLAGHLLFDLGAYPQARTLHTTAILAAHEAEDTTLEALAWGRISFTWTYSGQATQALPCIQRAAALASGKTSAATQAYLASVEAEIQAMLGEQTACLQKLHEAEQLLAASSPDEGTPWLRFDRSRLAGYQGICFQHLYHPEKPQTASFLIQAQAALQDALARLSPTFLQRRPALLIDLAGTYTRQGEVGEACEQAIQAVEIMGYTQSKVVMQRLWRLRQALTPWQQTAAVKRLDEVIEELLLSRSVESKGAHS
jgi:DNA-binding SARP family transcriptional activator